MFCKRMTMRKYWKILLILLVSFTLGGCAGQIFSPDSPFAPRPAGMTGPSPDSPPDYLQGWNDGCDTGLGTMVSGYYKSFYQFKQDQTMISNPVYYKAWKDAYTYCRHYSFRYTWAPYDKKDDFGPL